MSDQSCSTKSRNTPDGRPVQPEPKEISAADLRQLREAELLEDEPETLEQLRECVAGLRAEAVHAQDIGKPAQKPRAKTRR